MIHPHCLTYVAAASQTRGAALHVRSKYRAPSAPQSYLYACQCRDVRAPRQAIMRYLRTLRDIASACYLAVTRGLFLTSAHREVIVALVHT
jgi:hypothetical protein